MILHLLRVTTLEAGVNFFMFIEGWLKFYLVSEVLFSFRVQRLQGFAIDYTELQINNTQWCPSF